jgi:hypothetical protein
MVAFDTGAKGFCSGATAAVAAAARLVSNRHDNFFESEIVKSAIKRAEFSDTLLRSDKLGAIAITAIGPGQLIKLEPARDLASQLWS